MKRSLRNLTCSSVFTFLLLLSGAPWLGHAQSQVVAWGDDFYGQATPPPGLSNVVTLAGGYLHSLALRADQTVAAWGYDAYGQTNVPTGLSNAVGIVGGYLHSLAVKADGSATAWGYDYFSQTNVPAGLTNAVAVAAGGFFNLALNVDGTVTAWGDNRYGQANVPVGLGDAVGVSAGQYHSLALKGDGTVAAWGDNTYGQTAVPAGLSNVAAISAGSYHSLALLADGTVAAWGYDYNGQATVPIGLSNVVAVAAGGFHSLALKADGTVLAWGLNYYGETDVPAGLSNVVAIAAGQYHSLALVGEGPPHLTAPLVNRSVMGGSTVVFYAEATGAWPLSFQWQFSGTNLPGATSPFLILTNVQTSQAGAYTVVVSNGINPVASSVASVTLIPFHITLQPQSQSVLAGTNVTFSVASDSQSPLSYQWQLDHTNLPGATNATLLLTNVQSSQAGNYSVTLSNAFGVLTSSNALLSVVPLLIATQPQSQTVYAGTTVSLTVAAVSLIPPGYQWTVNGIARPGATNATLTITNAQTSDTGNYSVLVTNADGGQFSSNAVLVVVAPQTCTPPSGLVSWWRAEGNANDSYGTNQGIVQGNVTYAPGEAGQGFALNGSNSYVRIPASVSLNVGAGSGLTFEAWINPFNLNFQTVAEWNNGVGGIGAHLQISASSSGSGPAGNLYANLVDTSGFNHLISSAAGVITTNQFQHVAVTYDYATGQAALYCNGVLVQGQNLGPFTPQTSLDFYLGARPSGYGAGNDFPGVLDEASVYSRALSPSEVQAIYNAGGAGKCGVLPTILALPQSQALRAGGSITLSVAATGAGSLFYQWFLGGVALAGQTNTSLVLNPLVRTNSGLYSVVVSNAAGTTVTLTATVRALVPPVLQPPQRLGGGRLRLLFQDADGGLPYDPTQVAVQWRTNVPTATDELWQSSSPALSVTNGFLYFDDTNTFIQPGRFYRILEQ